MRGSRCSRTSTWMSMSPTGTTRNSAPIRRFKPLEKSHHRNDGAGMPVPHKLLFLFVSLSIHDQQPVVTVVRHLELECIGSGSQRFDGETSLHVLAAHHLFAVPRPGIVLEIPVRVLGLSGALERVVGV